jgi:hypothetical protein
VSGYDQIPDVPRGVLCDDRPPTPVPGRAGPAAVLDAVARAAVDAIAGAVAAVICVLHDNAPATFAGSHPAATRLDAIQFADGEGPSFEALCQHRAVLVDDVADWPEGGTWREVAADAGMTGVIALPVSPDGDTAATLSLYRRGEGGWSPTDLTEATAFSTRLRDLISAVCRLPATDAHRGPAERASVPTPGAGLRISRGSPGTCVRQAPVVPTPVGRGRSPVPRPAGG